MNSGDVQSRTPHVSNPPTEIQTQLDRLQETVEQIAAKLRFTGRSNTSAMLTVKEVASRLSVSVRLVERLIAEGKLIPTRIGGTRRFEPKAIDLFVRKCTTSKGRRTKRRSS